MSHGQRNLSPKNRYQTFVLEIELNIHWWYLTDKRPEGILLQLSLEVAEPTLFILTSTPQRCTGNALQREQVQPLL